MDKIRKSLVFAVFFVVVALIVLTWGSVGSAVLTLALLIGLGYYFLTRFMDTHDPDDFKMD